MSKINSAIRPSVHSVLFVGHVIAHIFHSGIKV